MEIGKLEGQVSNVTTLDTYSKQSAGGRGMRNYLSCPSRARTRRRRTPDGAFSSCSACLRYGYQQLCESALAVSEIPCKGAGRKGVTNALNGAESAKLSLEIALVSLVRETSHNKSLECIASDVGVVRRFV